VAFIPLTFSQIVARMLAYFAGQTTTVTDQNIGSVLRTLMEASAVEQERSYVQMMEGILAAIDQSAYNSFNFGLLAATASYGEITLTRTGAYVPDITVTARHQFTVPNTSRTYSPVVDVTWTGGAASTTKIVFVQALQPGLIGNTPASSITNIFTPITGVASVTNLKAFITGTDDETFDQRRSRFTAYVASLPRATKVAVEYGAKTAQILDANGFVTERVAKASAIEVATTSPDNIAAGSRVITPADMSGIFAGSILQVDVAAAQEVITVASVTATTFTATFVNAHVPTWAVKSAGNGGLYIFNGIGTPLGTVTSAGLVTQTQTVVDGTATTPGYRGAGIVVTATAATEVDTSIKVIITNTVSGYALAGVIPNAVQALQTLLASLNIGDTLYLSAITQTVRNVVGVGDCVVVLPAADTVVKKREIIVSSSVLASQFTLGGVVFRVNIV
jgi:uncharacterized phage protein gp47/JayE